MCVLFSCVCYFVIHVTYHVTQCLLRAYTGEGMIVLKGGSCMKRKLTSRKLWTSIASFVSMLLIFFNYSESTATQVSSLIMAGASIIGYVIGEGLADSTPNTSTDDKQ